MNALNLRHNDTQAPQSSFLDPFAQQLAVVESRTEWAGKQLATMLAEIATLRNGLSSAHQHAHGIVSANVSMSRQMSLLLERNDQVRAESDELTAQNAELLEIARQIAQAHSDLELHFADERRQNAQLRAAAKELESALDETDREANATKRALAEKDEEIQALTEALTVASVKVESFSEAKRELEALFDTDEGQNTRRLMEHGQEIERLKKELQLERANAMLQLNERQRSDDEAKATKLEVKRLRSMLLTR